MEKKIITPEEGKEILEKQGYEIRSKKARIHGDPIVELESS